MENQNMTDYYRCYFSSRGPVPMYPVDSSNIAFIGYRHSDKSLWVKFKSGAVYQYDNVTPEQWTAFHAAESKGRWFDVNIKKPVKADGSPAHPFTALPPAATALPTA